MAVTVRLKVEDDATAKIRALAEAIHGISSAAKANAGALGELSSKIDGAAGKAGALASAARSAVAPVESVGSEAKKAATSLDRMGDEAGETSSQLGGLKTKAQSAESGIAALIGAANRFVAGLGIATALVEAGRASLTLAANIEQTRTAFTSLLGSASVANSYLSELRDFSERTPFQFTELTEAARRLMGMGFAAKEVVPILESVGDAVAAMGGGAAEIDGITLALGQMQLKGRVSAEEMLQLSERGVSGWRYLAQSLGVTTAEAQKLASQGLIPVDKAIQAILDGMRQDFGGMMAQQAETASGRMSTLIDKTETLGMRIGDMLLPAYKRLIEAGFGVVDTLDKAAKSTDMLARMYGVYAVSVLDAIGVIDSYEAQARRVEVVNGDVAAAWFGSAKATESANAEYQRSITILLGATKTYEEFLESVRAMSPAQRDILRMQGYVNEEWYKNASAVRDAGLAAQQAAMVDYRAMERQLANVLPAQQANTEAVFRYTAAQIEANDKLMLRAGLEGKIQESQLKQAEIQDLIAQKQKQLSEAKTNKERNQITEELAQLETQARKASDAFGLMISQMIYQQASAGLSAEASLKLARSLGLISEQDYAVSAAVQNIRRAFDEGKIGPEEYARQVANLRDRVKELQSKNITITVENVSVNIQRRIIEEEVRYIGGQPPGRGVGMRAIGGPVVAGQAYIVGESGPELFVPMSSGVVAPNSNTSTTNDVTINIYGATNPALVAQEVKRQLDEVAAIASRKRK